MLKSANEIAVGDVWVEDRATVRARAKRPHIISTQVVIEVETVPDGQVFNLVLYRVNIRDVRAKAPYLV
jgi:hypothetical protein